LTCNNYYDIIIIDNKKGEITMILKITSEINIEEDEIIKEYYLVSTTPFVDIMKAVHDYVLSLDDSYFYLIGIEEEKEIAEKIYDKLQKTIDK